MPEVNQKSLNPLNYYGGQLSLKVLALILLAFLALIPLYMIKDVINSRAQRYESVLKEVGQRWGEPQRIAGPVLVLPYRIKNTPTQGKKGTPPFVGKAYILPEKLKIQSHVTPQEKRRGIYEVLVYQTNTHIEGLFSLPSVKDIQQLESSGHMNASDILWEKAYLSFGLQDNRGLPGNLPLRWGQDKRVFSPGGHVDDFLGKGGFHTHINTISAKMAGKKVPFSFQFDVNGSKTLSFVPLGMQNEIKVTSPWGNPSFKGHYLPYKKHIQKDFFEAYWKVSHFEKKLPQMFLLPDQNPMNASYYKDLNKSTFDIQFFQPITAFKMSQRAVKYSTLFVIFTFTLLFVFELVTHRPIHIIQYGLLALSKGLFFIMLLALSEHVGFQAGFWLSTTVILLQVSLYAYNITRNMTHSFIAFVTWVLLYSYLYIVLTLEDYALLTGALGLFFALSTIMYAVRNVKWYGQNLTGSSNSAIDDSMK